MADLKSIPDNIINPFSDNFLETWVLWKYWRKNELDNFSYKGVISEQMALKNLAELSEGDEAKAIKIIEQSIDRGWSGFYKVKTPSTNGTKSKKSTTTNSTEPASNKDYRDKVSSEFNKRYGGGGQDGTGDYLKAV